MAVNATAHFWTAKACLPSMMENNHGHIVTISSSAGLCGTPGLADYCASKVRLQKQRNTALTLAHAQIKTLST